MAALGDTAALLDPLIERAAGMAEAFVPLGKTFLALAMVITLFLAIYDWWLGDAPAALSRAVRAGIMFCVPLALLFNWTPWMKTSTEFFTKELTAPIVATSGAADAGDAVKQAIEKLNSAMFPPENPNADKRGGWRKAWDFVTGDMSVGKAVFGSIQQAVSDLILFFVSGLVGFALILALYGPLLALQLGVIFGPLLVAWLPWQPMGHLFQNWLRYMLANGLALVVGVTLATLGAGVIGDFAVQMAALNNDPELPFFMAIAVRMGAFMSSIAIIIFVAYYLMQAETIASSLIGGGGSGSSGLIGGIMRGARGLGRQPVASKPKIPKK